MLSCGGVAPRGTSSRTLTTWWLHKRINLKNDERVGPIAHKMIPAAKRVSDGGRVGGHQEIRAARARIL